MSSPLDHILMLPHELTRIFVIPKPDNLRAEGDWHAASISEIPFWQELEFIWLSRHPGAFGKPRGGENHSRQDSHNSANASFGIISEDRRIHEIAGLMTVLIDAFGPHATRTMERLTAVAAWRHLRLSRPWL
jgi:hypothetical protein